MQDLTLDLGPPMKIHYKDDDRMRIHAATKATEPEDGAGCETTYFNVISN